MRPAEQPRAALGTAYLVTPRRTIVHLQHLYRSHGKRSVRRDFWVSFKIGLCSDLVGMAGFEPAASCSQSGISVHSGCIPCAPISGIVAGRSRMIGVTQYRRISVGTIFFTVK